MSIKCLPFRSKCHAVVSNCKPFVVYILQCTCFANVIECATPVPVPLAFQPALVTVTTMSPASATIISVLICPSTPAASVAVSAAASCKSNWLLLPSSLPLQLQHLQNLQDLSDSSSLLRGRVSFTEIDCLCPSSPVNWNS